MTENRSEITAGIAARKQTADRQSVMAIVGMIVIAGFLTIHPGDLDKTVAALLPILPWLVGLSALIVVVNRWTLALLRRSSKPADGARKG
ncbi:UPF0716 family protein affecting phage T7 exclusion [Methylopila capsulata]|uniref:UPF0716 family protein affecting phage T7 exclusion n=1 Tax=Methylopila capsulata TaxID=61654 RepID=A0A9W6IV63_9HYPH|nr:hypothetical protein [Methylopila capsulata]MBM7852941.1 UPF0716 family protein affecting phage T7 exclusion [Methylopila capsulata]GLK57152.1 hypothetical protein GCM10008170_31710 [Methylopila capsulata]